MLPRQFDKLVDRCHAKASAILINKERHYGTKDDRLTQFKSLAEETGKNPTECLIDMAQKHWSALRKMAKNPRSYDDEVWQEHCLDLMNYSGPLMMALIIDVYGGKMP
jgi:hypothetical protein